MCLPVCLRPPLCFVKRPATASACLSAYASTPLHIEQCCMRVSGGCGVKRKVQRTLQEPPPAVVTVQLQWEFDSPSSIAVQKTLEDINMVHFSLHDVCSNTQSGPLQCFNRVKQSDAACVHTCASCGHHTNPVCRIRPILQRPGHLWQSPQALSYLPAPAAASDAHRRCSCHPGLFELLLLQKDSVIISVGTSEIGLLPA